LFYKKVYNQLKQAGMKPRLQHLDKEEEKIDLRLAPPVCLVARLGHGRTSRSSRVNPGHPHLVPVSPRWAGQLARWPAKPEKISRAKSKGVRSLFWKRSSSMP